MAHDILKSASSEMYQVIGLLTVHAWQMFPFSTVQMTTYTDPEEGWSKLLFEVMVIEQDAEELFVMEEKFIDAVCENPLYQNYLDEFIIRLRPQDYLSL